MDDLYLITNTKDKIIEKQTKDIVKKDKTIMQQYKLIYLLYEKLAIQQYQLDRNKEHSKQIKLEL